jgi:excisionase family DNA binding protein
MDDTRLLSAGELAKRLDISARTVRDARWRRRAGIPATRVGGRLLFRLSDLDEALARGRERLEAVGRRRLGSAPGDTEAEAV